MQPFPAAKAEDFYCKSDYEDAPIIILDEATANVDPENEAELQKAIEALTLEKQLL